MTVARKLSTNTRRQRGVYAVEYAFVFLIFFTLLYAIICYGIFFTLRFAMQNAAEDGARAALRYQINVAAREDVAKKVAEARSFLTAHADAKICQFVNGICESPSSKPCNFDGIQHCRVFVTITTADIAKVLPPLPNFAVPDKVVVQASILFDGGGAL